MHDLRTVQDTALRLDLVDLINSFNESCSCVGSRFDATVCKDSPRCNLILVRDYDFWVWWPHGWHNQNCMTYRFVIHYRSDVFRMHCIEYFRKNSRFANDLYILIVAIYVIFCIFFFSIFLIFVLTHFCRLRRHPLAPTLATKRPWRLSAGAWCGETQFVYTSV